MISEHFSPVVTEHTIHQNEQGSPGLWRKIHFGLKNFFQAGRAADTAPNSRASVGETLELGIKKFSDWPELNSRMSNMVHNKLGYEPKYMAELLQSRSFYLQEKRLVLETDKHDTLQFYIENTIPLREIQPLLDKFWSTWSFIRETALPQVVVCVFVRSKKKGEILSAAQMCKFPSVVIECHDDDLKSVTVHEAVHAVFGAEAGSIEEQDFVEGCATRIAEELLGERDSINSPSPRSLEVYGPAFKNAAPRSSTAMLEELPKLNAVDIYNAPYFFGYYFIDVLLQVKKFRSMIDSLKQNKNKKYSGFLLLNKTFSARSMVAHRNKTQVHGRDVIHATLKYGLGWSDQDIAELFETIRERINREYAQLQAKN